LATTASKRKTIVKLSSQQRDGKILILQLL
jgi:hypothetical protein